MSNPIQYTSRTYDSVISDINNDEDLIDKPEWFKRYIAGSHDVLSMYENAIANESHLRTCFTRQAAADLLALIDYELSEKSTSSGSLCFYLDADSVSFPKVIDVADLAARNEGTLTVSSKKFEARSGTTMSATAETFTTDFASDSLLDVARVYTTGEKVRVSTTNTLPSPLAAATDYYVIYSSDTEIELAETLADAFAGTNITLLSDGVGTHTITLYSVIVTCYQQETKSQQSIGTSDGTSIWQQFDLPDLDVIRDTLEVEINSVSWTVVTTLVDSESTDKELLLRYNTDNSSYLLFGNGTYGAVPGNFAIYVTYAIGGGILSNVSKLNSIVNYAGSDSDVLGVSNVTTFTGGASEETIASAKILAPILLKARDRFVTSIDGEALANNYLGVALCGIVKNAYGVLSAQVPIVPSGGGSPSSALKTALQTYLIDRTILEEADIRVTDPTYNTVTIVAQVKVLTDDYTFTDIKPYVMLALRLLFYEASVEITNEYEQDGIAAAVTAINTIWSTSFSTSDYTQIATLLDNLPENAFDKDFQESDVLGYVDSFVDGVDYLTISSPAFPITQASDEITTDNILTGNITEIT